ncbi:MAG: 5'-3' exonuclease H3TH domain-containing protein, partial [Nocardioidaceae bacterium]
MPASAKTTRDQHDTSASSGGTEGRRLLLLDGHSLAYRAFYALPAENFRTATGQTTNAVYGFTSMLINLLRDEQPTHLAVAFDVSRKTLHRTEAFAEYKANRSETPDDFKGQVELIQQVLDALRIPWLARERFEADDLIATLVSAAVPEGFTVSVCTGDRDVLQLVTDVVTVLYPRKGVSELTRFTPEAVQEKYELTPAQYPDFAAIRGDPSDNLPKIPGVGEKTAAKWVRDFGSLSALVDRVDEVKGKAGDALRSNIDNVLLNRELTELVRDVPIDVTPDTLAVQAWDRDAVHQLFDELEFRVLRDRLFAALAPAEPEAEEGFQVQGGPAEPGELAAWLREHGRSGCRVGMAPAAHWSLGAGDVSTLALASDAGVGIHVDFAACDADDERALAEWLADEGVAKCGHDVKPAMHALRARGFPVAGVTSDTALAAYLVRPGQRSFGLDDLVLRYLKRELRSDSDTGDTQLSLLDEPDADVARQASSEILRAYAIGQLADALDTELAAIGSAELLR